MTSTTRPQAKPSRPASRRGRPRNAQHAREAILDAAEAVFAQHGFAGARVDAIARASSYNVSLPFQYFTDKLGLYAAVLGRAQRETTELQARVLGPLLADPAIAADAHRLRAGLQAAVQASFDYLVAHPRLWRILTWEMADGWRTYAQIAAQFPTDASGRFAPFFKRAWSAGLLRSDFSPLIQLALIFQVCQSYFAFLPMYRLTLPAEALASEGASSRARQHLVGFIVGGMLLDAPRTAGKDPAGGTS